jgi:hypothetical protein
MILDEIGGYMQESGIVNYKSKMPDAPDDAVCLYEYGGPPPVFAHDGQAWEQPRLQVISRSKNYQAARTVGQTIYDLLNGKANVTIGAGRYLSIAALQSPFALGHDENDRHRIVINFELIRA